MGAMAALGFDADTPLYIASGAHGGRLSYAERLVHCPLSGMQAQVHSSLGSPACLAPTLPAGLLTYSDTSSFDSVEHRLCGAGLCSRAVSKEQLLPAADLQGAWPARRV